MAEKVLKKRWNFDEKFVKGFNVVENKKRAVARYCCSEYNCYYCAHEGNRRSAVSELILTRTKFSSWDEMVKSTFEKYIKEHLDS